LDYPSELKRTITLPGPLRLHVRPLCRGDRGSIVELDNHLSRRTRYLRFLSPLPAIPDYVLNRLVCLDYWRDLALVAAVESAQRPEIVALASYGAIDQSATVEVGAVVGDDWQRRGIGTILAASVLEAAEARGFDRFVAHLLSENDASRALIRRVGCVVSSRTARGVAEVAFVRKR
jgi:acetyltransferase